MKNFLLPVLLLTSLSFFSCKKEKDPEVKTRIAWAVGPVDTTGYGTIIKTIDGGNSFIRQGLGLPELQGIAIFDLYVKSASEVWVVGEASTLLHTTDSGNTWIKINLPNPAPAISLYGITYNNGVLYVSGDDGVVYKSSDDGINWSLCNTSLMNDIMLQGIWAITPDRVFAVGQYPATIDRGLIAYTEDGGNTWDSLQLADDFNRHQWIGVSSYGNTIVINGGKNYYVFSRDNGVTWTNDSVGIIGAGGGADMNHLVMLNEDTWWAAMDNGHLVRTDNAGETWNNPTTGLNVSFMLGMDFWNNFEAIAVGEGAGWPRFGPVTSTSNAGNSWAKVFTHDGALHHVGCVRD